MKTKGLHSSLLCSLIKFPLLLSQIGIICGELSGPAYDVNHFVENVTSTLTKNTQRKCLSDLLSRAYLVKERGETMDFICSSLEHTVCLKSSLHFASSKRKGGPSSRRGVPGYEWRHILRIQVSDTLKAALDTCVGSFLLSQCCSLCLPCCC